MQYPFSFKNEELILDADRAIYWPKQRTLILTDLHLGKVGHFHTYGLAIPSQIVSDDYARLDGLNQRYIVDHWICLGDLFHSRWNKESPLFLAWRDKYPNMHLTLVAGNHDRHSLKHIQAMELTVVPYLEMGPFYFIHDWQNAVIPPSLYPLAGHLHPAVKLYGKGRQRIKLPCFWFQKTGGYLPAFGQFTGNHLIEPSPADKIYAIAEQQIICVD